MTRVTMANKILRKINHSSIVVFFLIGTINIFGSSLIAAVFEGQNIIENLLMNSGISGGIYFIIIMVIVSINMTHTGVDYLISLNVDRKSIFNAIVRDILRYTLIMNLIFTIIIALNSHFGFGWSKIVMLFGMRGNELNALSYIVLFLYLLIIGYFIMAYMMFVVLLAKRFGWHYLVGTLLLTLSLSIICMNEIRLLLMIGNMIPLFFVGFAVMCMILTLIDKMLIEKVEFKR